MQLASVAEARQAGGHELRGAVHVPHVVVQPTPKVRVDGRGQRRQPREVGAERDVFRLQVIGRGDRDAPLAGKRKRGALQLERQEEVHDVHAREGTLEHGGVRLAEHEALGPGKRVHDRVVAAPHRIRVLPVGAVRHHANLVALCAQGLGVPHGRHRRAVRLLAHVVKHEGDLHARPPPARFMRTLHPRPRPGIPFIPSS